MTTKNKTNTKTTPNQAVEATSTEQAAQPTVETENLELAAKKLEEAQQTVKLLKAVLKDKKKAKVKTPCAKADCKLFACEGGKGFCSNHRPLNNDELDFAATLAQEMNGESLINLLGDQRIRMMFRNQQQKG